MLVSILPPTNIDSFVTSGGDTSTVTGLAWASVTSAQIRKDAYL
jgi:hypothetical protein